MTPILNTHLGCCRELCPTEMSTYKSVKSDIQQHWAGSKGGVGQGLGSIMMLLEKPNEPIPEAACCWRKGRFGFEGSSMNGAGRVLPGGVIDIPAGDRAGGVDAAGGLTIEVSSSHDTNYIHCGLKIWHRHGWAISCQARRSQQEE